MSNEMCPYCSLRPRDSNDHIFSEFLGGTTTVRACTQCNNTFGHDFEGGLSCDLASFVVTLCRCGLRPPRFVVWKRAVKDTATGIEYDIDTDLHIKPSYTKIERDEAGNPQKAVFASRKSAAEFVSGLEAHGKKVRLTEGGSIDGLQLNRTSVSLPIGQELRRLAVKMAVGTADYLGHRNILDASARTHLMEGKSTWDGPARIDLTVYKRLEDMRPPLGHSVYVEGDSKAARCFAIIQFYGTVQLYAILNARDFKGPDFAALGTLDLVSGYKERFADISALKLPEPPVHVSINESECGFRKWQEKFNEQAHAAFGNALTMELRGHLAADPSSTTSTWGSCEVRYVDETGSEIWRSKS